MGYLDSSTPPWCRVMRYPPLPLAPQIHGAFLSGPWLGLGSLGSLLFNTSHFTSTQVCNPGGRTGPIQARASSILQSFQILAMPHTSLDVLLKLVALAARGLSPH